ncbi:MAG: AroM family protein [Rhodospirillaceae bacterium]|nr:AroM family protein [Rhodospirillaceae bacterium]
MADRLSDPARPRALCRPVTVPWQPDAGIGALCRLGVIVLATDEVSEAALHALAPGGEIAFYVTRLPNANPTTVENLRRMAPGITDAVRLMLPDDRIDAVIFACTSGAMAMGDDGVRERVAAVRPGVPVVTPGAAVVAALGALGTPRVALLTPYIDEVNDVVRDWLAGRGVAVVALTRFDMPSDSDMAKIPPQALHDAAIAADDPEADAVVILCTALRAWPVIETLEARLGKPVVTSHQAMLWHALSLTDTPVPAHGFGRLAQRKVGP